MWWECTWSLVTCVFSLAFVCCFLRTGLALFYIDKGYMWKTKIKETGSIGQANIMDTHRAHRGVLLVGLHRQTVVYGLYATAAKRKSWSKVALTWCTMVSVNSNWTRRDLLSQHQWPHTLGEFVLYLHHCVRSFVLILHMNIAYCCPKPPNKLAAFTDLIECEIGDWVQQFL